MLIDIAILKTSSPRLNLSLSILDSPSYLNKLIIKTLLPRYLLFIIIDLSFLEYRYLLVRNKSLRELITKTLVKVLIKNYKSKNISLVYKPRKT